MTSGREISSRSRAAGSGCPHQRGSDEDGVRARQLRLGAVGARMDRALRDHDAVPGCPADEIELRAAVDGERGQIAGVDPDRVGSESRRTLELSRVVRLDERVEPDRPCVGHERGGPPVVEVAQDQKRCVGARVLQVVELRLGREEPLGQERQPGGGARSTKVVDGAREALVDEDRDGCRAGLLELRRQPGRIRVGPEVARRGRSPLDLGDCRQPAPRERVAKPSHQAEPPETMGEPAGAVSAPTRYGRGVVPPPSPMTIPAKWCPVCADSVPIASGLTGHARTPSAREKATSRSRRSAAAPESTALRASSSPSRRSSACPAAAIAPAALSRIASRGPPPAPAKTSRIGLGVLRRRAAAEIFGPAPLDSQLLRVDRPFAHPPACDLAHLVRAARRQLVDPAGAVDDERALRSELQQHLGDRPDEPGCIDADDLRAGAGRVRQRTEHVEDRSRRELASHGRSVTHRRVMGRCEQEAEAELVDRPCDPLRRQLELEAERLEHVRRSGRRRDCPVAVLRDARARGRRNQRRRRRDVESPSPVSTGSGGVHEVLPLRVDGENVGAHRVRTAGDLVCGLALRPQRHDEACDLRVRRLAAHDRPHRLARFVAGEVVPVEHAVEACLDHRSRKFSSRSRPTGSVSTDSGWNWTPSTGSSRWRTPITSPSSLVADTVRQSGTRVAASEW